MFPIQEVKKNNVKKDLKKLSTTGKSFLFDFKLGEFKRKDGKILEASGIDALKVWIQKILTTEKNKYDIYKNTGYGVAIKELIMSDHPYAFVKSEIEREIREALLKNTDIRSVERIEFERNKRNIMVSFICNTIYGELESEVNL